MAEFDDKLNELLSNPDSMAQIMRLAQSLSGETGGGGDPEPPQSPPQTRQASQDRHHQGPPPENGGGDLLSGLTGGLDPKLLMRLLPLLRELGGQQDSNARALVYALRPYLKPERQEKVERALQLARLFHLGKKFLAGWEGS